LIIAKTPDGISGAALKITAGLPGRLHHKFNHIIISRRKSNAGRICCYLVGWTEGVDGDCFHVYLKFRRNRWELSRRKIVADNDHYRRTNVGFIKRLPRQSEASNRFNVYDVNAGFVFSGSLSHPRSINVRAASIPFGLCERENPVSFFLAY